MENKLSHDKPLVIFVTTFVVIMAWRNTPAYYIIIELQICIVTNILDSSIFILYLMQNKTEFT